MQHPKVLFAPLLHHVPETRLPSINSAWCSAPTTSAPLLPTGACAGALQRHLAQLGVEGSAHDPHPVFGANPKAELDDMEKRRCDTLRCAVAHCATLRCAVLRRVSPPFTWFALVLVLLGKRSDVLRPWPACVLWPCAHLHCDGANALGSLRQFSSVSAWLLAPRCVCLRCAALQAAALHQSEHARGHHVHVRVGRGGARVHRHQGS
jgi:hypothetical protein